MKRVTPRKRDFDKPRCINCGIRYMIKRFTIAELEQSLQEIFKQWLLPLVIEETHSVCDACVRLAAAGAESAAEGAAVPRALGHKEVCLSCGVTLNSVRGVRVDKDPACQQLLLSLAGPLAQNTLLELACKPCWQRVLRTKRIADGGDHTNTVPEIDTSETSETAPGTTSSNTDAASATIPRNTETKMLTLPSYKRARFIPRRCIFKECPVERPLFPVPLRIRQKVLRELELYISNTARICNQHIAQHDFNLLSPRVVHTFSSDHIEDMIFLMKNIRPIDFRNIKGLDSYLRETWLGVTWDEFKEVLDSVPELTSRLGDAQIALAMYFAKKHAKEGDEVISSLFQVPRPAMAAKVSVVEQCLARRDSLAAAMTDNNQSSLAMGN